MNVPKLRFKEFSGEWEEKLIGDCFVKINDRNKTKSINNIISNTAKYGLVKQEQYFDKDIAIQENTENYYVIDKGDFVYNPRKSVEAPYGPIRLYQLEETGIVSPLYLCFRSKNKLFDYFYNYFFQSSKWYRYIYRNGDSGARADRVNIKDEVFFSLNTFLPILDEQEKIVDFLDIVCRKINNQQAIVESLEKEKKALMKKIFSQELRFKDDDGKEFPDWEEKKLGEIATFCGGGTPSKDVESFWQGDIPWISSADVSDDIMEITVNKFITKDAVKKSATKLLPRQTILIVSRVGVGKVAISDFPLCTSQDFTNITDIQGNKMFFAYLIKHIMKRKILSTQGTSIKGITSSEIKTIVVNLPVIKEQNKIVGFLEVLDEKIRKEKNYLEHWRKIKKGLLQQMFV